MSFQVRVTAGLAVDLGSSVYAATWAFATGLVLGLIFLVSMPSSRLGFALLLDSLRERQIPWWLLGGGVAGASWILAQGLSASAIGIAMFTIFGLAGQSVAGLLLDHWGVAGIPKRAITLTRILGSGLAITAVATAFWGRLEAVGQWWQYVLPCVVGALIGWQQAVNGRLRQVSKSWVTGVVTNLFVGFVVLAFAAVFQVMSVGGPSGGPTVWWHLLGGVLGLFIIIAQVVTVGRLGVLLLSLTLVVGQLAAAVIIDVALPLPGYNFNQGLVAAAFLAFLAVLVAVLPRRKVKFESVVK